MTGPAHEAADAHARAWESVLDRLERDLSLTEELAGAADGAVVAPQPVPWEPPELHGPLPDHLLHRAREIHRRQTEAKALLSGAIAVNRRQVGRVAQRPQTETGPAPAYVDVSA